MSNSALLRLPLLTLYATDRCNSRCVSCDYWRHGEDDMSLESVGRWLPDLAKLQTRIVLLSGGEPLLNRNWRKITELLRASGVKVWLLTSGLALAKHARAAAELFDAITVSLDGADPCTYAAIRGVDAYDKVCEGIRAVAARGRRAGIRITLQRANFRQLPEFVDLARSIDAREVSFLAVDVANAHAFGGRAASNDDLALQRDDLPILERILDSLEQRFAAEFRTGFIAQSPAKLRRLLKYFTAIRGLGDYPAVRCNAPEFSAVMGATGSIQPCFFIAGPTPEPGTRGLSDSLNEAAMRELRGQIRSGSRAECKTCVCSLWRDLRKVGAAHSILRPAPELAS